MGLLGTVLGIGNLVSPWDSMPSRTTRDYPGHLGIHSTMGTIWDLLGMWYCGVLCIQGCPSCPTTSRGSTGHPSKGGTRNCVGLQKVCWLHCNWPKTSGPTAHYNKQLSATMSTVIQLRLSRFDCTMYRHWFDYCSQKISVHSWYTFMCTSHTDRWQ